MSTLKTARVQIGKGLNALHNFIFDASSQDGRLFLRRENGQEVVKVNTSGKVTFPQNANTLVSTTYTGTTVGAATQTALGINVKTYDPDNLINPTTGIFQPNVAGWYQINATLSSGGLTVSGIGLTIRRQGGSPTKAVSVSSATSVSSPWQALSVAELFYMNGTTDQIFLQAYSAAGSYTGTGTLSAFLVKEDIAA